MAVTVRGHAKATVTDTFLAIVPIDLVTMFRGFGPLPGVVGTRDQTGPWDHVGARRCVELADGSEASETITAYERPHGFSYRVGPFTGPIRHLVEHADGEWTFAETAPGLTAIRWTYTFRSKPLRGPVLRIVIVPLWRPYARRALALAIGHAERGAG